MKVRDLFALPREVDLAKELARSGGPFGLAEETIAPPVLRPFVEATIEIHPQLTTPAVIDASARLARLNGIVNDLIGDVLARDPFALWRPCKVTIETDRVRVELTEYMTVHTYLGPSYPRDSATPPQGACEPSDDGESMQGP